MSSSPPRLPLSPTLARARQLVPDPPPGNAIADLAAEYSPEEVAERRGMTVATVRGIRSFYDQLDRIARVCAGTACRFAGGDALRERLAQMGPVGEVRCLGHCYAAPTFRSGDKVYARPSHETTGNWLDEWGEGPSPMVDLRPVPRTSLVDEPVSLRRLLPGAHPEPWSDYALPEGQRILDVLAHADLRARGAEGTRVADAWHAARDAGGGPPVVVANDDEGDPGAYLDRLLLEEDPHALLAGMLACARAIGARTGIAYVRAEYPRAVRALRAAIAAARERGVLGDAFDVEVVTGAGSYVCGDDSALLRAVEGLRGEPALPAYPGAPPSLGGSPAVVLDVETFAQVPWTLRNGRASRSRAVCLAGAVQRPGVVEIPQGMPLSEVLARGGGGAPSDRAWGMALIGGPLGRVLPASRFDTPLDESALPGIGHAGVVVLDEHVTPRALAEHVFAFARAESCGSCAPCRIGSARLAQVRERDTLERLLTTLEIGSLCDFGRHVPRPLRDLLAHYGEEVLR